MKEVRTEHQHQHCERAAMAAAGFHPAFDPNQPEEAPLLSAPLPLDDSAHIIGPSGDSGAGPGEEPRIHSTHPAHGEDGCVPSVAPPPNTELANQPLHWGAPAWGKGALQAGVGRGLQGSEPQWALACKQPMQLQPCNVVTTVCRVPGCADSRCVCGPAPEAAGARDGRCVPLPQGEGSPRYGSYLHNLHDTFAAYCHPQPIPAPAPSRPPTGAEPNGAADHLAPPRLVSSVSETGLDAKHLLRCCGPGYSWAGPQPPGAPPPATRDVGVLTTPKQLRDVGVQTGPSAAPHVFPRIRVAEESGSETSRSQNLSLTRPSAGAGQTPVKEVKWDAEGMTWEVYGASVDPEELGLAIQKHLELQIKETASRVGAKPIRHDTGASQQSAHMACHRKKSRLMGSIRTCCSRTSAAVD